MKLYDITKGVNIDRKRLSLRAEQAQILRYCNIQMRGIQQNLLRNIVQRQRGGKQTEKQMKE